MTWLLERLAGVADAQRDPTTGRPRSVWRWIVLAVVVLVGAGVVVWLWRLRDAERRELARLRHEKNRAALEADNARAAAAAAELEEEMRAALRRVADSEVRVARIDEELAAAEDRHDEALDAIGRLTLRDLPVGR